MHTDQRAHLRLQRPIQSSGNAETVKHLIDPKDFWGLGSRGLLNTGCFKRRMSIELGKAKLFQLLFNSLKDHLL